MKHCPNCGVALEFENPKFCPECGFSLAKEKRENVPSPEDSEEELRTSIFELGNKLEEVVEKIYRSRGYATERRQRLMGGSGTRSEIDIVARKSNRIIAIECKNYVAPVGIDKVRDFNQKLQDLGLQGHFIAYSGFTDGASQFAQSQNIETIDRSELMEKWLAISIGRGECVRGEELTLECALPLNVTFDEAKSLSLLNSEKIKVIDAELIFRPYFSIDYSFRAQVKDPTKKLHKFKDEDTVFVDAVDGEVLNPFPERGFGLIKTIKDVASKTARAENERTKKMLRELKGSAEPTKYSLEIMDDYKANKVKPLINPSQAMSAGLNYIIERNTRKINYTPKSQGDTIFPETKSITYVPKRRDIRIGSRDLILVPRWSIEFEAFNKSYRKEIFACSGTVLEDTISSCPNHVSIGAITFGSHRTVAVCEVCGQSLCQGHVKKCAICGKWLCEKDGIDCGICNKRFCKEHEILACPICHEPICESCSTVCSICGTTFGINHANSCDVCEKTICPNCTVVSGLIRKNRKCVKCAN